MCLFIVCYTVVLNTPEYYAIENQAICVHNPNPTLSYAVCTPPLCVAVGVFSKIVRPHSRFRTHSPRLLAGYVSITYSAPCFPQPVAKHNKTVIISIDFRSRVLSFARCSGFARGCATKPSLVLKPFSLPFDRKALHGAEFGPVPYSISAYQFTAALQ